jgi:hypothetical protein
MTRIGRAAFGWLGAFAMAGVLAASAWGATVPTWYECGKAQKVGSAFVGHYTTKACEASAEVPSGGHYELRQGIGKGKSFKGKGKATTLQASGTLGSVAVTCRMSVETGTPALPNLETGVAFTFRKCKALGTKNCTTAGARTGEVTLSGLKGELSEPEEPAGAAAGLKLESEAHPGPEGTIASFGCEGLTATIKGSLSARQTQDINLVTKRFATIDLAAEASSGPEQPIADKGEALMIKTNSQGSEPPHSILIGEQLEHESGGDSKKEEITPVKFKAAKSGTVEEIYFETSYAYSIEGEHEAS